MGRLNSFTVKAGGNYNVNEWTSAYTNLGYLSRAPLFNSVFDLNNNVIQGYENQYVKAVELGVKYAKDRFASNINAYRTGWENKAINRFYSVSGLWQDANLSVYSDTTTTAGRENLSCSPRMTGRWKTWTGARRPPHWWSRPTGTSATTC